jgi:hypothetical protein
MLIFETDIIICKSVFQLVLEVELDLVSRRIPMISGKLGLVIRPRGGWWDGSLETNSTKKF